LIRAATQSNVDSADSPPSAGAESTVAGAELTLIVELRGAGDDELLRVISLLHRRRCRVTAAEFSRRPGVAGRLTLRLLAPPSHARRVEQWLASLIDVHAVARA
jgi:hypothetical protein